MRLLSQRIGKPPVFIEKIVSNWWKVFILSELLAVLYMCIVIQPEFNERMKVSENALLPALVTERFNYYHRLSTFLNELHTTRYFFVLNSWK